MWSLCGSWIFSPVENSCRQGLGFILIGTPCGQSRVTFPLKVQGMKESNKSCPGWTKKIERPFILCKVIKQETIKWQNSFWFSLSTIEMSVFFLWLQFNLRNNNNKKLTVQAMSYPNLFCNVTHLFCTVKVQRLMLTDFFLCHSCFFLIM